MQISDTFETQSCGGGCTEIIVSALVLFEFEIIDWRWTRTKSLTIEDNSESKCISKWYNYHTDNQVKCLGNKNTL